ncbi:MAG TPA: ribonuclease PH [bacterium]|nr:ribonuclease PH [bacterium]HEX68571.1 ribonuclease PH [bacterium]
MREGREDKELREIEFLPGYLKHPEGSCFVKWGNTWVICSVRVEEKVPPFLQGTGSGWVTAEYGMLPGSTNVRVSREYSQTGRSHEIQRMIGRSLRAVMNLEGLGERTLRVDCDVIQADGGTRMASVCGGFIALIEAVNKLYRDRVITHWPIKEYIAGVSVGKVEGRFLLDLEYSEDSIAEVDMNVVMTESGRIVELQSTAEKVPFTTSELNTLLKLANQGIEEIIKKIKEETIHLWKGS